MVTKIGCTLELAEWILKRFIFDAMVQRAHHSAYVVSPFPAIAVQGFEITCHY